MTTVSAKVPLCGQAGFFNFKYRQVFLAHLANQLA
jgi:hypothetical protein